MSMIAIHREDELQRLVEMVSGALAAKQAQHELILAEVSAQLAPLFHQLAVLEAEAERANATLH